MKNPSISDPEDGYISILVDDTYPANKKGVIIKGQKPKYFMKAGEYDELKGYLYFTVYEAGVLDTDKEFMKSEDLDFMHLDLMKNMRSTKLADINHDQKRLENVWLMEIWKEVDSDNNTTAIKGAYYIKDNEYLMGKAKDGKINGVSIMGRVEDIVDEPLSKFDKLLNWLMNKHKDEINNEENDMTKEEIANMTDEQLDELGLQRKTETPEEPEKPADTEQETPEEPEVSEIEELKSSNEALTTELDTLKAEREKLKSDFEELRKMKKSNNAENAGEKKELPEISKTEFDKLDTCDKISFKMVNPKLYNELMEKK